MYDYLRIYNDQKQDCEQVVQLLNQYLSFGLMNDMYLHRIIDTGWIYAVKNQGKIIACATMCPLEEHDFLEHDQARVSILKIKQDIPAYLFAHMVVDPNYRGKGIAKQLMEHMHQSLPIPSMVVGIGWVQPQGWEAEPLLTRWGYQTHQIIPAFWFEESRRVNATCQHCSVYCECSAHIVYQKFIHSNQRNAPQKIQK